MIRYLSGTVIKAEENKIVLLTGGVGYEVLLPEIVRHALMQDDCLNKTVELVLFHTIKPYSSPNRFSSDLRPN